MANEIEVKDKLVTNQSLKDLKDYGDTVYATKVSIESTDKKIEEKVDISVLQDILNGTPHAATIDQFFRIQRNGKIFQSASWLFEKIQQAPEKSCWITKDWFASHRQIRLKAETIMLTFLSLNGGDATI